MLIHYTCTITGTVDTDNSLWEDMKIDFGNDITKFAKCEVEEHLQQWGGDITINNIEGLPK